MAELIKDVNTSGYRFYPNNNSQGLTQTTLVVGHWKDFVTLKLHPELPENLQNDNSKYNYKEYLQVVLKPNKVYELAHAINLVKEGAEVSQGVQSGPNLVTIARDEAMNFVLSIHSNIGEEGKPENSLHFVFNTGKIITGYNPETGEYAIGSTVSSDLELFIISLMETCKAQSNAQVHAHRVVNNFNNVKITGNLEAIASKLGLEPIGGKKDRGTSSNGTSYFNAGGGKRPSEDMGSVEPGGYIEGRLNM